MQSNVHAHLCVRAHAHTSLFCYCFHVAFSVLCMVGGPCNSMHQNCKASGSNILWLNSPNQLGHQPFVSNHLNLIKLYSVQVVLLH